MPGHLSSIIKTIYKQLTRYCTVNNFGYQLGTSLAVCGMPGWPDSAKIPAPSPEDCLCHLSLLSGISTLQLISLFVTSSLLASFVCLAQLLWFKMEWLIKQTIFSCTLYTGDSSEEVYAVYLTHPLSSLICLPFFPETKEKWLVTWNMHTFRKGSEMSRKNFTLCVKWMPEEQEVKGCDFSMEHRLMLMLVLFLFYEESLCWEFRLTTKVFKNEICWTHWQRNLFSMENE